MASVASGHLHWHAHNRLYNNYEALIICFQIHKNELCWLDTQARMQTGGGGEGGAHTHPFLRQFV